MVDANDQPCEVIGVMPSAFSFPSERTRAWLRFPVNRDPDDRGSHGVLSAGKLRAGVSLAAAREENAALMSRWKEAHTHHKGHGLRIASYLGELVGDVRLPLVVISAAVGLVLVVLVANVSSLFLSRGTARLRELAVRQALGAGRSRLARLLATEAFIVAIAGGLAGTTLAGLSSTKLIAAYPGSLPRASTIAFDVPSGLILVALSLVVSIIVAVIPAVRVTGRTQTAMLRSASREGGGRKPQLALVVSELGLSAAVTVGALLLVQSFVRLQDAPLGFDAEGVVASSISLPATSPSAEADATAFFAELRQRIASSGTGPVLGAISSVPLINRPPPDFFVIEGEPVPAPGEVGPTAHYVMATPGALEALRVPLQRGRLIDDRDTAVDAPIAVINEALQRRYWPAVDAIGRRFRYPTAVADGQWTGWSPWITVVGVVADVRSLSPSEPPQPAIYVSYAQRPRPAYSGTTMMVVARGVSRPIREVARDVHPRAVGTADRLLSDAVGTSMARPRFMGRLMTGIAAIAFLIALVGLYALVSYGVARRSHEIGVRFALGASRIQVLALAGRQLMLTLCVGLPAGLMAGWLLARWMSALLYDVRPWEPMLYATVAVGLAGAAILATLLPLRRALRIDPLVALRSE